MASVAFVPIPCVGTLRACKGRAKTSCINDIFGKQDVVDTRTFLRTQSPTTSMVAPIVLEEIPKKLTITYSQDYNILTVDQIIRKKLNQEKYTNLPLLQKKLADLKRIVQKPQTYIARLQTIDNINDIERLIAKIDTNENVKDYDKIAGIYLDEYRKFDGRIKTKVFNLDDVQVTLRDLDDDERRRIYIIDSYLMIASKYIDIEVNRISCSPVDVCIACGTSLAKVAPSDGGCIRCPDPECQTEHPIIAPTKSSKEGSRVCMGSSEDESIDNFLRAFIRYQGLQMDGPPDILYDQLDEYFSMQGLPIGDEIMELPLNDKGRRGDTNHKMLWTALSEIGKAEYYEDANLIGHIYWGWTLPDVMRFRETIIDHYNKTQKVFYQIPSEERCRTSSLGTQYRLWRHLQMVGHECYMDEFKIAENPDSIRTHNKLWRLMCEGTHDASIHYIH